MEIHKSKLRYKDLITQWWFWGTVLCFFIYLTFIEWRYELYRGLFYFILDVIVSLLISLLAVSLVYGMIFLILYFFEIDSYLNHRRFN